MPNGPSCILAWAGRFLFLAALGPLSAATIVLEPQRDNSIYFDQAGSLSNARGPTLIVGNNVGNATRRALLAFDLSSIPAGSVIESVSLGLHLVQAQSFPTDLGLHRLTADWGEGTSNAGPRGGGGASATPGDATWLHRLRPGDLWTTPGGDFLAAPSATSLVAGEGTDYFWLSTPSLVADVQHWLDDPSANFGWMLRGDESQSATAKAFASRDTSTVAQRPALTVTYAPVPEPTTGALLLLGIGAAIGIARRRESIFVLSGRSPDTKVPLEETDSKGTPA